ncbi:MAG: hypothetical protein ACOC33_02855 [bacterium]
MNTTFNNSIHNAINEKDVENIYRETIKKYFKNCEITSPFGCDGLLEHNNLRSLLEFKYNHQLKEKLAQASILTQMLFYVKKFEDVGEKLPNILFVGDKNECFALHTNSIVKYLSKDINWQIAPSGAAKENPEVVMAMVDDVDIMPFVFDINDDFDVEEFFEKIKDLSESVVRKIRITKKNIVAIFDYFNSNVLHSSVKLSTNEKANLFIQIVINPEENYLHPSKKNILISKSFGNIQVNSSQFKSFFQHFDGQDYSPREKEGLTEVIDRLIEDVSRRRKGEFYTPSAWVLEAHKMIDDAFGDDWREKYIVYDPAWGTGNLTRDFKFKELYCSTLEQSDIDTANQMGYNPEATKFQFDFLNDSFDKLPAGLKDAIDSGKEIIFLINPPYGTANNMDTKEGSHKAGIADTLMANEMKKNNWGGSSQQLYAQFIYRIFNVKNSHIALFSPSIYKTGSSFKKFREKFYTKFEYGDGMLFNANHFSDTASSWGIDFSIWKQGKEIRDELLIKVKDEELTGIVEIQKKNIYNIDKGVLGSKWIREEIKTKKSVVEMPNLTSAITSKDGNNKLVKGSIGYLETNANNVYSNSTYVTFFSAPNVRQHGLSIIPENYHKVTTMFTARKSIQSNWINQKDEYLAPNVQHPEWKQFANDSIVYSLFNNSSQQSSLRGIMYKDKEWDIKNEFFWLSKDEMLELANDNNCDNIYQDAKYSDDRFVYKKLFGSERVYDKLSPEAKTVLDMATELLKKSMAIRKVVAQSNPDYHLDSWDAGYSQLKLVWKDWFKDEFKSFREDYKRLEEKMQPMVYKLGFLK